MNEIRQTRAETAVAQLIFDFGRRLEQLGMNFAELARRLGVSRARVSELMSGRQNPTIGTLMKIAEIMGCYLRIELAPLELPVADEPFRSAVLSAGESQRLQRRRSPVLRVAARAGKARKLARSR